MARGATAEGRTSGAAAATASGGATLRSLIPAGVNSLEVDIDGRRVRLTNLQKPFWPELGITKGDLIRYYEAVSPALLPHVADRAMVMKRYPNGAAGDFFFMKRTPNPRPDWLATCSIEHARSGAIDFPIVQDLASLMWIINLGCIDLNPWYARCDDTNRPDYLHFDLDPVSGDVPVPFERVAEAALLVRAALEGIGMRPLIKTTGSRGLHVYVPIFRGPTQKEVWTFAKAFARIVAHERPELVTVEYRIAKRPAGRVLVDYNQNAWGRTLASVYSVRPRPRATVSAPVTWQDIERGIAMDDFRLDNMPQRLSRVGDLWAPLFDDSQRVRLEDYLKMVK